MRNWLLHVLAMYLTLCTMLVTGPVALSEEEGEGMNLAQQSFSSIEELEAKVGFTDIIKLDDGRLFMAFDGGGRGAHSSDGGKTWGEPFMLQYQTGEPVAVPGLGWLVVTKSGAVGFAAHNYPGPDSSTFVYAWYRSTDGGRTWSEPVRMNPRRVPDQPFQGRLDIGIEPFGEQGAGAGPAQLIVLSTGRIVAVMDWLMPGPIHEPVTKFGIEYPWPLGMDIEGTLLYSYSLYSDDEGQTWKMSRNVVFIVLPGRYPDDTAIIVDRRGKGGFWEFEEPTIIELKNGDLLMFGRSVRGRIFQSVSRDGGETWHAPTATELAAPNAPAQLRRLGKTGDLLVVFNQCAPEENIKGYSRHRLSTAISRDDGRHWGHFRNLESLDDVSYIEPPPLEDLHGIYGPHYRQPKDRQRYVHAPGSIRSAYACTRVLDDVLIVSYSFTGVTPETPDLDLGGSKRQVLPIESLYDYPPQ